MDKGKVFPSKFAPIKNLYSTEFPRRQGKSTEGSRADATVGITGHLSKSGLDASVWTAKIYQQIHQQT